MSVFRWMIAAGVALATVAILAALFAAYRDPAMMVDFANLVFCG